MSETSKSTPLDDYATYATTATPLVKRNTHPESKVLDLETLGKPIDYVRLTWVDLANTVRYRVVPWDQYAKLLSPQPLDTTLAPSNDPNTSGSDQSQRRGMTIAKVVFGYVAFRAAPGFGPIGDWLWVPDENSLRIVSVEGNNIASVFGWFREKSASLQNVPVPRIVAPDCPRSLLARVVRYARETAKIKFLIGVELEFILLSDTKEFTPVNKHSYCDSASLPTGSRESTVLQEIADNLQNGGIELLMYHAEGTEGQYEVITGPLTPLEAADALIYSRETIINTAVKHGLRATFSPRVFTNGPGSGQHTHLSIQSTVSPIKSIPASSSASSLNVIQAAFLASFLAHLPAIQAFSQPFPASYLRVQDRIWSGGTHVAWGTNNKEAPVRLVDSEPGWEESRRFEIRPIDGLANPYLAFAAILAAGTSGVVHSATLAIRDLNMGSAASLSEAERSALGIRDRLSQSWTEARAALEKDEELVESLGKEFVKDYLSVNGTIVGWLEEDKESARQKYVEYY